MKRNKWTSRGFEGGKLDRVQPEAKKRLLEKAKVQCIKEESAENRGPDVARLFRANFSVH